MSNPVIYVLSGLFLVAVAGVAWVARLASKASAESNATKAEKQAQETQQAQLDLTQAQVSAAPTDEVLQQKLQSGTF